MLHYAHLPLAEKYLNFANQVFNGRTNKQKRTKKDDTYSGSKVSGQKKKSNKEELI